MTCAHVRLLGPCFKTGRMGSQLSPQTLSDRRGGHVRTATAVGEHCEQSTPVEMPPTEAVSTRGGGAFLGPRAGRITGGL